MGANFVLKFWKIEQKPKLDDSRLFNSTTDYNNYPLNRRKETEKITNSTRQFGFTGRHRQKVVTFSRLLSAPLYNFGTFQATHNENSKFRNWQDFQGQLEFASLCEKQASGLPLQSGLLAFTNRRVRLEGVKATTFYAGRRYGCGRSNSDRTCRTHCCSCNNIVDNVQGGPKKLATFLYAWTSSNSDRFSNFFQCLDPENIRNNAVTQDPTTPQVCRYTTYYKTTSVTTHFKKLTTGNDMFIV